MRKGFALTSIWALTAVILLSACGPIRATTATATAEDHLYKARLAGAHELTEGEKYITPAQYEYQLARIYVSKSKELQGFAKYDEAYRYAREAIDLAKAAVEHMKEAERRKIRREQIKAGKVFREN